MSDLRKIYAELHNALQLFVKYGSVNMTDEEAVSVSIMHEEWYAGRVYTDKDVGRVISYNSNLYRIASAHTAQAHYPPDGEGLLALYRPIVLDYAGTTDDPIPFVYGMDCVEGLCYSYNEKIWLCKIDMKPCVWPPGTEGMWQWEEV